MKAFFIDRLEAPDPIGSVFIASNASSVVALDFLATEDEMRCQLQDRFREGIEFIKGGPEKHVSAVRAYFAGDMSAFDGLLTDGGGSPFQEAVWALLRAIPAGETRSYGQLAKLIGRPQAARAVGHANGRNPVNLIVPCHRVIGSTGALTGYGPGIERKRWLLDFEATAVFSHTRKSRA